MPRAHINNISEPEASEDFGPPRKPSRWILEKLKNPLGGSEDLGLPARGKARVM
jgi:hypothetical protein